MCTHTGAHRHAHTEVWADLSRWGLNEKELWQETSSGQEDLQIPVKRRPPALKDCFVQMVCGGEESIFIFLAISYLCSYYEKRALKPQNSIDLHNHTQRRQYSKQVCVQSPGSKTKKQNRGSFDPHLLTCSSNTNPGFPSDLSPLEQWEGLKAVNWKRLCLPL